MRTTITHGPQQLRLNGGLLYNDWGLPWRGFSLESIMHDVYWWAGLFVKRYHTFSSEMSFIMKIALHKIFLIIIILPYCKAFMTPNIITRYKYVVATIHNTMTTVGPHHDVLILDFKFLFRTIKWNILGFKQYRILSKNVNVAVLWPIPHAQ